MVCRLPLDRRLGQHHLRHGASCRPLVRFLEVADQRVLEIGVGGGALTRELIEAGARVLGCELDRRWLFASRDLRSACALFGADALQLDYGRLPDPTLVAGNLPYNVATALIQRLLGHHLRVPRAAFMVQREVADRLTAEPGEKSYGSLSVLTAACAHTERLGRIGPGSFRPPPKVESAMVGLRLRPPDFPLEELQDFASTVRLAFAHKRKILKNALVAGWGREVAEALLAELGLPAKVRAEQLGLEIWLALFERLRRWGRGSSLHRDPTGTRQKC